MHGRSPPNHPRKKSPTENLKPPMTTTHASTEHIVGGVNRPAGRGAYFLEIA